MAHLDSQKNWGDRAGGVSDPRLVRQVDMLAPRTPTTEHQLDATEKVIRMFAKDERELQLLREMILPEDRHGHYAIELKEAA